MTSRSDHVEIAFDPIPDVVLVVNAMYPGPDKDAPANTVSWGVMVEHE